MWRDKGGGAWGMTGGEGGTLEQSHRNSLERYLEESRSPRSSGREGIRPGEPPSNGCLELRFEVPRLIHEHRGLLRQ